MKYIVEWSEYKTTSTGKKKADATLKDEAGVITEGVTIWENFPGFNDIRPGSTLEGDVTVKVNGQYTNKTLNAPRAEFPRKAPGAITQAMAKKEKSIEKFQEQKTSSIEKMACFRDATLLTVAWAGNSGQLSEDIKAKWEEFHKWLENKLTVPF